MLVLSGVKILSLYCGKVRVQEESGVWLSGETHLLSWRKKESGAVKVPDVFFMAGASQGSSMAGAVAVSWLECCGRSAFAHLCFMLPWYSVNWDAVPLLFVLLAKLVVFHWFWSCYFEGVLLFLSFASIYYWIFSWRYFFLVSTNFILVMQFLCQDTGCVTGTALDMNYFGRDWWFW